MSSTGSIHEHRRRGRIFAADGVAGFVRAEGAGDPVLCVHGVPVSSFTYRRLLPALAERGLRGVAVDLPGLGFAERPLRFDYSWSGLGRWLRAAVDVLGLGRFHLLVHDIGGPVGFELAAAAPERVRSLTVLDTMVRVDEFRRPWMMELFARERIGELWLASLNRPAFRLLMRRVGWRDRHAVSDAELDAHLELLRLGDGGRAFLRIMRGFELDRAARARYERALGDRPYPVQVVWGAEDPILRVGEHGEHVRRAAGAASIETLPARHFVAEECPAHVGEHVARIARGS